MYITIEIKTLMNALTRYNPSADLTGLKAYLFDVMSGTTQPPVSSGTVKRAAPPSLNQVLEGVQDTPLFSIADDVTAADLANQPILQGTQSDFDFEDDIPPGVIGAESAPRSINQVGVKQKGLSPLEKKAQRDKKRLARPDFSKMDGKSTMEFLTNSMTPQKKDGQTQFVDMGIDGASDNDIEMG